VAQALEELQEYQGILEGLGLGEFVEFDLKIVRGLAYYTGIVFELFDRKGELRAICGGGRYDRLLELVGGEPLPAVGFGMGDVVLGELLEERGLLPKVGREVDLFLVSVAPALRPLVLELARAHRDRGRSVVYALRGQSVRKQFSAASSEGARWVVVLGPDEVEQGVAVVRDMGAGTEGRVSLDVLRRGEGLEMGMRRYDPDEIEAAREVTARALRRLNMLEYVILFFALVLALLGGALVAWVVSSSTDLAFRWTWAGASLLLFVLPGALVYLRERRKG
jgi:hypothetical protein